MNQIARIGMVVGMMASLAGAASAADWPEIPASDRTLTEVVGQPNAAAVVLREQGRLVLNESSLSCFLEVYRRIKILTEEGVDYGSVTLGSNDAYRMKELEGRTLRPDGTIVALGKDAVFKSEYDEYYSRRMTSFAMPEVAVGSIVEYRYKVYFDSVLFPSPWFFQSRIPVLFSQVSCIVPKRYAFLPHAVQTLRAHEMESSVERTARGLEVTYVMRDMPPVPDEPSRYPFADLSARVTFLPVAYTYSSRRQLFETWESTIKLARGDGQYGYQRFRTGSRKAKAEAKRLLAGVTDRREGAEKLYRFVRDSVVTEGYVGVFSGDSKGDDVLKGARGDIAEKALLLQVMLEATGYDAGIAWANPADVNHVDKDVPNPMQFDRVLVVLTLDGERVFLDPTFRTLAFGALDPDLEGTPSLLIDGKEPEWVTIPESPADASQRTARLEIVIDDDGRASGTGTLGHTGHEAWLRLGWKDTREETITAWTEWLEGEFSGFDIDEVTVTEDVEARTVDVGWRMTQREEEVLGDEVTFRPGAPLDITSNRFSLAADQRQTPVHLSHRWRHQVELRLTWPDGWVVEVLPEALAHTCLAGSLVTTFEVDDQARTLVATRVRELAGRAFIGFDAYRILRGFYEATVTADAARVVVMRE